MFENLEVPKDLYPADPRFGVGPSLIPEGHVFNLYETGKTLLGTSHRKKAVINLCKEVQDGLRSYFNLPSNYEVVMGNGGATFLFDMIGLGLVKEKSVHFTTGEFSTKWYDSHANIPWIDTELRNVDFGEGQNPVNDSKADMICCTLNETSTGVMINSLPNVGDDKILAVDATSGAGQIAVDFNNVDLYFFSPQKVFASDGGFYVCIMSPKAVKRAREISKEKRYIPRIMDWNFAIDNSIKSQTYNTPSISTIFLLNEQIKLMNTLGEKEVIKLARKKAKVIYDWANEKEYLSCFVKDETFRSIAVATVNLDPRFDANQLAFKLREQEIVLGIEGYRKLGKNQFRISLFHNVSLEDLVKLTKIISYAIEGEMNA